MGSSHSGLEALRGQIQPSGCLPFLLEDYGDVGDGAYVAVLKSPDKMEILIQSGIAGAGANYDLYDDRFLEIVRDWDARFGIDFVSIQGRKGAQLSIKFHRMPDDLHAFLGEATDFCPTLLELATSEAELWENMEEFAATSVLSLWWD